MRIAKTFLGTLFGVWALTLAVPAAADLVSATSAYEKGDYAKAFADFRGLAELGQPTAQFNLAVMYAKGQGARQSAIYAYAWASLAASNGLEKGKVLADELRPQLAPGSEQIAADIEAEYANAVLDARLNPKIIENQAEEAGDRRRCSALHPDIPSYPKEALDRRIEGQVYVEFSLLPDGRGRNLRIIYAVPEGFFEPTVRSALLHSQFGVGAAGAAPVQCTMFYRFLVNNATAADYPKLQRYVADTLAQANAGDPHAQMLYGMLLVGLPQLNRPISSGLPWFLKSAKAGVPAAQYQVGFSLLKGWGCDCEENKGLDWLRRAAQAGQPDAEVTLAMYALKGTPMKSVPDRRNCGLNRPLPAAATTVSSTLRRSLRPLPMRRRVILSARSNCWMKYFAASTTIQRPSRSALRRKPVPEGSMMRRRTSAGR
jgi:uncharacterized protein